MKYVGVERVITLPYQEHQTAEDYAAALGTPLSLKGTYQVIRTVTKYQNHEDSISYNTFLQNQQNWKREGGYQCTTVTGKSLFVPSDELGGNCILLEGKWQGKTYTIGLYHLGEVYVKVGDIIQNEQVLGLQGNTGLVQSKKALTDVSYGTHVHVEVKNSQGEFINPRPFASEEQTLSLDKPQEDTQKEEPSSTLPSNQDPSQEDGTCQGKALFVCPKDDTYYIRLKKGEELYLIKPRS